MTAGKWLKTACNLCYINCGIEVLVNDGRLEKVRGDLVSSPKSQGYLGATSATWIPILCASQGSAHDPAASSRRRRL